MLLFMAETIRIVLDEGYGDVSGTEGIHSKVNDKFRGCQILCFCV